MLRSTSLDQASNISSQVSVPAKKPEPTRSLRNVRRSLTALNLKTRAGICGAANWVLELAKPERVPDLHHRHGSSQPESTKERKPDDTKVPRSSVQSNDPRSRTSAKFAGRIPERGEVAPNVPSTFNSLHHSRSSPQLKDQASRHQLVRSKQSLPNLHPKAHQQVHFAPGGSKNPRQGSDIRRDATLRNAAGGTTATRRVANPATQPVPRRSDSRLPPQEKSQLKAVIYHRKSAQGQVSSSQMKAPRPSLSLLQMHNLSQAQGSHRRAPSYGTYGNQHAPIRSSSALNLRSSSNGAISVSDSKIAKQPTRANAVSRRVSSQVQRSSVYNNTSPVITTVTETIVPAVIHHKLHQHNTEVIREEINRDVHYHHYYTYKQPIHAVEVLPARHYLLDEATGVRKEIPIPDGWVMPASLTPRTADTSGIKGVRRDYVVSQAFPNERFDHRPNGSRKSQVGGHGYLVSTPYVVNGRA